MGSSTTNFLMLLLRSLEVAFAAVVAGIVGNYLNYRDSDVDSGSRIIFSVTIAGISLFVALLFLPFFEFAFYSFALDLILSICWIVDFGLGVALSNGCSGTWYRTHWGGVWGRPVIVTQSRGNGSGCGSWRAVLSFSFLSSIVWLISGIFGLCITIRQRQKRLTSMSIDEEKIANRNDSAVASNTIHSNGAVEETA